MARTLSFEQFAAYAAAFVKISDKLSDGWILKKHDSNMYVTKKTEVVMKIISSEIESEYFLKDEDLEVFEDSAVITDSCQSELLHCEYQVVYSSSYNVPVLYCRMWTTSGRLLATQEIWKFAPSAARGWSQLTVVPHPISDTPWVQVHPCKTAEIMGEVLSVGSSSENYIVTFLSIYGQAVGLNLTEKYVAEIHSEN